MKKLSLIALSAAACLSANAVFMLPAPEDVNHTIGDKDIAVSWHNRSTDEKITHYHVIVYKVHRAQQAETFILADNDFSYIESVGTINKHEHRGGGWANVAGSPGWYVKSPKYMDGAIGIDTYFYYPGSDNDDYFGGSYMLSPHYDLSKLTDPTLNVSASLAAEAVSVSGGFCIYAWSQDFWTEGREHYVPVIGDDAEESHDHHYDTLSTNKFQDYSESCTIYNNPPMFFNDRVRVCFYGTGYSMYWVDNLKVTVDMQPGDEVRYAAEFYEIPAVAGEIHDFTINTENDTDYDYVNGYQVRAVRIDPYFDIDTEDTNDYIRFISPDDVPEVILEREAGVKGVADSANAPMIHFSNGVVYVSGEEAVNVDVFDMTGARVASGTTNEAIRLTNKGVYTVKAGNSVKKVII